MAWVLGVGVCLAAVAVGPAAAWASPQACGALRTEFDAARESGDLARMRELYDSIQLAPSCSDQYRRWAGGVVARSLERQAQERAEAGASDADIRALLESSLNYQRNWRVLAKLGDVAANYGDYTSAARHYQQAIDLIAQEESTPTAPPKSVIETVVKRAQEARLLADDLVETPTTRSGEAGGLGRDNVRGFLIQRVAVPIRFEFDSVQFTGLGRKAAADLLDQLRRNGEPDIRLIGHTDPTGAAAYNRTLSMKRAQRVRDFLRGRGYAGRIRVEGRGEADPLALDDPRRYSRAQIHQMYRRVEVER